MPYYSVKEVINQPIDVLKTENLDIYYQNLHKKYQLIQKNLIETLDIIEFYFERLKEDIIINSLEEKYIVISDEGFFHHFLNAINALLKDPKNHTQLENLFNNRAVVFCYNSAHNIANQILKRQKETGRIIKLHQNKNFKELQDFSDKVLVSQRALVNQLKKYNIPVLEINTASDMQENVKKVQNFIKNLQKNRGFQQAEPPHLSAPEPVKGFDFN